MQPTSREIQAMNGINSGDDGGSANSDFFEHILSGNVDFFEAAAAAQKMFGGGLVTKSPEDSSASEEMVYSQFEESSMMRSRLQHQMMMAAAMAGGEAGNNIALPLTLGNANSVKSPTSDHNGGEGLYNGYSGSIPRSAQLPPNSQQFHHPQGGSIPGYGAAPATGAVQTPAVSTSTGMASTGSGAAAAPPRQRVRARRGQATDPHSIAERLRRERIAERMKALQELVPNGNKTDKASMLDEIIDYVKFLQLQVKVLSVSRLGGAGAVAPRIADLTSEGQNTSNAARAAANSSANAASNDRLSMTEHQVAKLMEEDMGSAMQYLQGKGLCLMPISLASAISSATAGIPRSSSAISSRGQGLGAQNNNADAAPTSPSISGLTVQSASLANGGTVEADASPSPLCKEGAAKSKH